jgi:hypothetical protein
VVEGGKDFRCEFCFVCGSLHRWRHFECGISHSSAVSARVSLGRKNLVDQEKATGNILSGVLQSEEIAIENENENEQPRAKGGPLTWIWKPLCGAGEPMEGLNWLWKSRVEAKTMQITLSVPSLSSNAQGNESLTRRPQWTHARPNAGRCQTCA